MRKFAGEKNLWVEKKHPSVWGEKGDMRVVGATGGAAATTRRGKRVGSKVPKEKDNPGRVKPSKACVVRRKTKLKKNLS